MYTIYPDHIQRHSDGACIPLDLENIDYMDFLAWQANGGQAEVPQGPTHAQLVEMAKALIRIQRQPIISGLDGLQISKFVKGETAHAQAIETAKQGLRDLTDIDLSACVTFEDMRLAVKTRYLQLAAALPTDVRKAFSEAVN